MTATSSVESIPSLESILDDGHGHINSNLAQAIYEWEVANNGQQVVNTGEFSTRDGLRLVNDMAREILASLGDDDNGASDDVVSVTGVDNQGGTRKSGISYNDLVQEGMIALLRAMSTYDNYKSHTTATKISTFQQYAQQSIQSSLLHYLAHSSRPIRLPLSLQTTLQRANVAANKLRQNMGKEPTLVQVANEVNIPPEQLALYRKLYRTMVKRVGTFVSVEEGIEVYDPSLAGVGVGTALHSRSDLDSNLSGGDTNNNINVGDIKIEGEDEASSSSGTARLSPAAPDTATGSEQDLIELNNQEDDWMREPPERMVAPLKDVLTDTEEINNPLSYTHHFLLNEELNEFLQETLSEDELTVIQLRFGLVDSKYGGKGWTAKDIGKRMNMDHNDVVKVASAALEKLRKAASSQEEYDAYVEVSL